MKLSVTNLAFPRGDVLKFAPQLVQSGITAVEIAPTMLWPNAPNVNSEVREFASRAQDLGLQVSAIQSLLYGHTEFQLFDRTSWPSFRNHIRGMLRVAKELGAQVAVFGSPKNRIRGNIPESDAHVIAADFFHSIIPYLEEMGIVLTLEPNAPAYGADYLVYYRDVIELVELVDSSYIQPQLDTGCLDMVNDDSVRGIFQRSPAHVHVSAAGLAAPPAGVDHLAISNALHQSGYVGWVTLEMLQQAADSAMTTLSCCRWLASVYGETSSR